MKIMKGRNCLVTFLVCLPSLSIGIFSQALASAEAKGRVEDGKCYPLRGVIVTLKIEACTYVDTTDSNGLFQIPSSCGVTSTLSGNSKGSLRIVSTQSGRMTVLYSGSIGPLSRLELFDLSGRRFGAPNAMTNYKELNRNINLAIPSRSGPILLRFSDHQGTESSMFVQTDHAFGTNVAGLSNFTTTETGSLGKSLAAKDSIKLQKKGYITRSIKLDSLTDTLRLALNSNADTIEAPFDVGSCYIASGWMGDGETPGQVYVKSNDKTRSDRIADCDTICTLIEYLQGPKGWAGIYWQYPEANWCTSKGKTILGATKVTFWAKGEKGVEKIDFKAGGIKNCTNGGTFNDSFGPTPISVTLTKEWKIYSIDVKGQNMSNVMGAFVWATALSNNPGGVTFYLDDIRYQ